MSTFTPLYVHTHFSLLGGPASPSDWCRAAAGSGYKSIGIADRGPLAGLPSFARAAQEANIEPIFGMELDILLPSPDIAKKQPVALFARDQEGLESMAKLAAIAYAQWPSREDAVTWEAFLAHSPGLALALLGGGANGGASAFVGASADALAEWGGKLKEHFSDAAFVGLPHYGRPEDDALAARVATAASQLDLPLLAMPAARYLRPEDVPAYDALKVARQHAGWKQGEVAPPSGSSCMEYLKPSDEAADMFASMPEAVENVARVVHMCSGINALGLYANGQDQTTEEREQLQGIVTERLLKLLGTDCIPEDVEQRLLKELDALEKRKALPAWSALATMGHVLRNLRNGQPQLLFGAPLGTADGSLLAYALGISPLNPLDYAPPAWLNYAEDENSLHVLPPPGLEVPSNRRDAILAAITREYGPTRTALAACPIDIDPLTAIWAASHVLSTPGEETRVLALQVMSKGWDALATEEDSATARMAIALRGAPLTFKPDADMLLVAPSGRSLPAWLPVLHMADTQAAGWVPWAEETVAHMGLPAITLRPSASLALLDTVLHTATHYPVPGLAAEELDMLAFPDLSAEATVPIIRGEVLGIPYIKAATVKGWKGEITVASAATMVVKSLVRGKPPAAPKLDLWTEKTADTGGDLLYRDQFDALAYAAAELSPLKAAKLRRAILGKDAEALSKVKASFAEACARHDLGEEDTFALWQALSGGAAGLQSRYAATAWGRVAMWAAHIKAAHPAAYMAALFGDNIERSRTPVPTLADEARRLGVAIKAPHAGYSQAAPSLEREGPEWAVLWGLALVPGWGRQVAERFTALRPKEGFAGMSHMALAAVDAGLSMEQIERLVRSGGCDNIAGQVRNRDGLLKALPAWLEWAQHRRAEEGKGRSQMEMFAVGEIAPLAMPDDKATFAGELSPRERYLQRTWEKEHLGIGFTGAAEIEKLNKALEDSGDLRSRLLTSIQLTDEHIGKSIYLVGLLTEIALIAPPPGRNGGERHNKGDGADRMAVAWVEDIEGAVELVAFPPSYKRHAKLWAENNLVTITGRVSKHVDGALYLLCEHLTSFHGATEEAEISVNVQQMHKKATAETTQQTQSKPIKLGTVLAGMPAPHKNGTSNGNHTGGTPVAAAASSAPSASLTMMTTSDEPATYRLTITLPVTDDDRADIDRMIALKELLSAYPGSDPVTLRIAYSPETGAVTSAQLPRGVAYSTLLEAQVVSLLSPNAIEVTSL